MKSPPPVYQPFKILGIKKEPSRWFNLNDPNALGDISGMTGIVQQHCINGLKYALLVLSTAGILPTTKNLPLPLKVKEGLHAINKVTVDISSTPQA